MGSYSVQQLDPGYISKVNPQQVQKWVEDGIVKQQGNSYYVVSGTGISFPESCFVKGADGNVQIYQLNGKGLIVEKSSVQSEPKGKVVSTQTDVQIPSSMLIERMGLTQDETLQAEFLKYMVEQQKLNVDQDGNINFQNMSQDDISKTLTSMMKGFAELHPEKFVNPNAEKYVEFTSDSDAEAIQQLAQGENPAIAEQPEAEGSRRYAVRNEGVLKEELSTPVGEVSYESSQGRSASIEATSVTTTTTKEGVVDVPEGLSDSKKARKQVEADAREGYAKLLDQANSDPELRNAIDLYIAESKYSKKIEKKEQELLQTTMGTRYNQDATANDADIVRLYFNKYLSEDDKNKLYGLVEQLAQSTDSNDQKALLDAAKEMKLYNSNTDNFADLSQTERYNAALVSIAKSSGFEPKDLLKLMATYEVLNERSADQVLKDDKYFIEAQAKDFVKNQQVQQDAPNTRVYFSKESRKNAPEDGQFHNDIGKKGRKLVESCAELFGTEVSKTDFDAAKNGDNGGEFFEAEITNPLTGEKTTKYFKFNEENWKKIMRIACDPESATEEDKMLLKNYNMTLQEGRNGLEMLLPINDGTVREIREIIGNDNGATDNRELNAWRDMVESAGYSIDRNTTAGKRLLHVLKNAGIGYGIGFLTGGLGSLLGGALQYVGQTAAQTIGYSGVTDSRTFSGTTADRIINDKTTFKYSVNGEEFSKTVNKDIFVEGQDWSVTADGQEYSGTVRADGQNYGGSMQNHLETANNAGILGGIGGLVHGAATVRGVNARGRNTDDVFDLTRLVSTEGEPDTKNLSIEIPQFTTVETRRGEKEVGFDIAKLPAVRWQGPAAYHRMYKYEDGTPVSASDFAKAYKKQINGEMTNRYFYVFPELEVNGKKLVPVDNYEEEYKKIQEGVQGTVAGVTINPQGKRKVTVQGTIRS